MDFLCTEMEKFKKHYNLIMFEAKSLIGQTVIIPRHWGRKYTGRLAKISDVTILFNNKIGVELALYAINEDKCFVADDYRGYINISEVQFFSKNKPSRSDILSHYKTNRELVKDLKKKGRI